MRKYYYEDENFDYLSDSTTIHKTYHTSIGALTKMIDCCNGNIGKPIHVEKVDNVGKTFSQLWAKLRNKKISSEGAT